MTWASFEYGENIDDGILYYSSKAKEEFVRSGLEEHGFVLCRRVTHGQKGYFMMWEAA